MCNLDLKDLKDSIVSVANTVAWPQLLALGQPPLTPTWAAWNSWTHHPLSLVSFLPHSDSSLHHSCPHPMNPFLAPLTLQSYTSSSHPFVPQSLCNFSLHLLIPHSFIPCPLIPPLSPSITLSSTPHPSSLHPASLCSESPLAASFLILPPKSPFFLRPWSFKSPVWKMNHRTFLNTIHLFLSISISPKVIQQSDITLCRSGCCSQMCKHGKCSEWEMGIGKSAGWWIVMQQACARCVHPRQDVEQDVYLPFSLHENMEKTTLIFAG